MTVLIDDRAGSKELILHPPLNEKAQLARLESGDVLVVGNGPDGPTLIGVELKSISDLISSMNTGRLQAKQIPAMLEDYDVCWLLHYGLYRPCPVTGRLQMLRGQDWKPYQIGSKYIPYTYVENMLHTLTALGVRIKRVASQVEAVAWLASLIGWWTKPWDDHNGMRVFDNSRSISFMPNVSSDVLLRARIAAQLPGVGYKKAMVVANHFGSVREMVNADLTDWKEIPGVGKVIAQAVQQSVGE
jgi:hypothetical protein